MPLPKLTPSGEIVRYAAWRPHVGDPRFGMGWIVRDAARPVFVVVNRLAWTMRIAAAFMLFDGEGVGASVLIVFLSAIFEGFFYLAFALVDALLVRSMACRVAAFLTLPPPAPPFPCRMEVFEGGTRLGEDFGIVTFLDGWLHFEGARTDFSLRPDDVRRSNLFGLHLKNGQTVRFNSRDSLKIDGKREENLAWRFVRRLDEWIAEPSPEGASVFPPRTVHLSGVARAWTNLAAGSVLLVVVSPALAFAIHEYGIWGAAFSVPFLLGVAAAVRDLVRVRKSGLRLGRARTAVLSQAVE